jgi:hypothetical protein
MSYYLKPKYTKHLIEVTKVKKPDCVNKGKRYI